MRNYRKRAKHQDSCWIHLIGCSVLMITNLIDKPKWYLYLSMLIKQVLQTGFIVDCTNYLQMRTGLTNKIKTLILIADIDCEQDQLFRGIKWLISKPVLDQGPKVIWRITRARVATNAWLISSRLEVLQESLYLLCLSL